jgi:glycosyltransferase involved in cell wall biosynthesis
MKVLIVHPCKGFYGGAEEVVVQLCNYLIGDGHKHRVRVVSRNIPKEFVGRIYPEKRWIGMWRRIHKWLGWADVVCCFNFPATLATFPTKKPIVWYCNEPPELFTNWKRKPIELFNRWWVKKSGMKVMVADEFNALRFQKIYGIEPRVIPYGIDYEFWSQGERIEKEFILLQVGHPELFYEGEAIFYKVQRVIPSAKLIQVIGGTHEFVRSKYHEATVLIHPMESHGGWLVPFEAMCAGLPVIVSTQFTGADTIRKYNLGIVTDDIAGSVIMKEYRTINTEGIKEWVKENLTWEKFGESMVKVFEETNK